MSDPIIYQPTVNRAKSIGKGTKIGAFCDIGADVEIGEYCNIQCRVSIPNGTKIGNNVFIGPNTTFLNDRYPPSGRNLPPVIEDDVIIGGSCTIFPGVKISSGVVVGGCSAVTKSLYTSGLYFGSPAKFKYSLNMYLKKRTEYEASK
jgi:acetyltransferase-like isoleucine patch superfamily enzyme